MTADSLIIACLTTAWLLPLFGTVAISLLRLRASRLSGLPGVVGVGCVTAAWGLACLAGIVWLATGSSEVGHEVLEQRRLVGDWYTLASFGALKFPLGYAIDSLTIVMFALVTLISTAVHLYSLVYLADERTECYLDHHLHGPKGEPVERPGRFGHFYAALGLFTFAMLGIVLAHGLLQIFVFWELVGFSSYLLIGFYQERWAARQASFKAFLMNRVGDVGFVLGMTILLATCGTLLLFPSHGAPALPETFAAAVDAAQSVPADDFSGTHGMSGPASYTLLVAAGLGLLAGCVGKSAQFPLHTWLVDAMEGPTPVSALVHSATMVAAGVYLAARVVPVLLPEALLVLAYVGITTLLLGASMALVARDLKQVLAHSTISQLGMMLLGIGVGAWEAALFHLVTHAFFKSLLFLGAGSVIYAVHHEQDLDRLGGLRPRLPLTAFTMLIGVLALSGLAVPYVTIFGESLGFSGFHSKDAIVSGTMAFVLKNPQHLLLLVAVILGACLTAAYSLRLWLRLFASETPAHLSMLKIHEGPWPITLPLVVLAVLAAFSALGGEGGWLSSLVQQSAGLMPGFGSGTAGRTFVVQWADPEARHAIHGTAGAITLTAAWLGALIAWAVYGQRIISAADLSRQFGAITHLATARWYFDRLYRMFLVQPVLVLAGHVGRMDKWILDPLIDAGAAFSVRVSAWSRWCDEGIIDKLVDGFGRGVWSSGLSLRKAQTGHIRQYVLLAAAAVVVLFLLLFAWMPGGK
ncbi:MAG: NADH-quinone oxidoreductase subunit L [Planctomyces sp.]|nr:NADH-quinone oxidoreductase subunit L [Planctomyces sp.]